MSPLYYTDPDLAAIDHLASSGLTNSLLDRKKAAAMIVYGERRGKRDEAIMIVRAKRANWLEWLTVTQRKWQAHTRRSSRARHHDSVAIRDRYVRCGVIS